MLGLSRGINNRWDQKLHIQDLWILHVYLKVTIDTIIMLVNCSATSNTVY